MYRSSLTLALIKLWAYARKVQADAIVVGVEHSSRIDFYLREIPSLKHCIVFGSVSTSERVNTFSAALESGAHIENPENRRGDDEAALLFSGGTTGDPKCAVVSHRYLNWNMCREVPFVREKKRLLLVPGAHFMGLWGISSTITHNSSSVMLPKKKWNAPEIFREIKDGEIQDLMALPSTLEALVACWEYPIPSF